jgi:hypothetical protein
MRLRLCSAVSQMTPYGDSWNPNAVGAIPTAEKRRKSAPKHGVCLVAEVPFINESSGISFVDRIFFATRYHPGEKHYATGKADF